jgi:hypothetical protein
MHRIENSIFIAAPPAKVWSIIVDLPSYSKWNSFITSASVVPPTDKLAVGSKNTITVAPLTPNGKPADYINTVSVLEPERELRWWGTMVVAAVFRAEHWCCLEAEMVDGVEGTRFTQGEQFTGLLVPLASMFGDTFDRLNEGHVRMNGDLKKYAEES